MEVYNFRAIIINEIFYNHESHWGVFSFKTEDSIPHVKITEEGKQHLQFDWSTTSKKEEGILSGQMQHLTMGNKYEISAKLSKNKTYGWQYNPIQVSMKKPNTYEEQEIFLQALCSRRDTKEILRMYPDFINDVIDGKTDFKTSVKDLKFNNVLKSIQENYMLSDIFVLLTPLGITFNLIKKITNDITDPLLLKKILYENPYILTRIHGLGFKKIDQLALKINPDLLNSENRARAFIKFTLKESSFNEGHTLLPLSEVKSKLNEIVPESKHHFVKIFEDEQANPHNFYMDNGLIGLHSHYVSESIIHERIQSLSKAKIKVKLNPQEAIKKAEKTLGLTFTQEQIDAILSTANSNFVVITGNAGTGKSTVVSGILELYAKNSIAICALAAKAAQRVTEITGHPASTIHRLLQWRGSAFAVNSENPIVEDIVIVDEASMINLGLFRSILEAVKDTTKLIIVFDHAQLPPIGAGNVASDILKLPDQNVNRFTKIHRQAEKSGILLDANKIRRALNPVINMANATSGELLDMHYRFLSSRDLIQKYIVKAFFRAVSKYGEKNVVIIVPRKKGVLNSTTEINKVIQTILFDKFVPYMQSGEKKFYLKDRVIQRVNNYKKNIVNGEIGYVTAIRKKEMIITFFGNKEVVLTQTDIKDLDIAYALTVHSYQGSQSDVVIVGIDYTHYILLDNCLLYTAITRASKSCLVVAEKKAFSFAVKANKNRNRRTFLKKIIAKEINPYHHDKI